MPAPAYVSSGTFVNTATKDSSIQPTITGSAGNVAICAVAAVEQGVSSTTPSLVVAAAQGFRALGPEIHAAGFANTRSVRAQLYYKVLAGSDTAPTFQMTGGTANGVRLGARIHTFSDVGVFRLATAATGDAATITAGGITSKAASGLIAAFTFIADGNTIASQAFAGGGTASITEQADDVVGSRMEMGLTTGVQTLASATGNFTATPSGTDPWAAIVLALEETEAFPSASVIEPFTYSDGDLSTVSGGVWAPDTFGFSNPDVRVASNRAAGNTAGDHRSYLVQKVEADGEVAAAVPVLADATKKASMGWRIREPDTASVDGFEMEAAPGAGIKVFRIDDGVYTLLATLGQELVAGDTFGARFASDKHEIIVVPASGPKIHVSTITDASYNADPGHVAICTEGTVVRMDDFRAGPLVAYAQVVFAPTITATMTGVITRLVALPGEMDATLVASVAATAGDPLPPADIAFAPTIIATMTGRIVFQEALGRPRGRSPVQIVGPLGGGQQDPSILARGQRGLRSGRLLARMRR